MTTEIALCHDFIQAHSEDAARAIERLPAPEAAALLAVLPARTAARALDVMMPALGANCLARLAPQAAVAIVTELRAGRAAVLLRHVGEGARNAILALTPPDTARTLRTVLAHPPGSAGAVMDSRVVTARDDGRVGNLRAALRRATGHTQDYVYVVDEEHRLTGIVALRDLVSARPGELLSAVMSRAVARVHASANRAAILNHPGWRRLHALPVIDDAGVLVGAITHETVRALGDEDAYGGTKGQDAVSTVFALGELYWLGLSGVLDGVAAAVRRTATGQQEVPNGAR